ncbi:hypothetical protein GDO81_024470 [Engystomops pustulosus]|uniref:B30.2/SPRY domain-containing protein n=1 Tax=Engystomops pustulosus TaxID=76066 RepID=A0AAV6YJU9_ENGPU|nr:hypothetical protein GDO81_024470 [Engystomops pustulosus]
MCEASLCDDHLKVHSKSSEHILMCQKKADVIKENIITIFKDIRRHLDLLEKKLSCELSSQEEKVLLSVTNLIEQLETKEKELSMEIRHAEEMCNMTDPIALLKDGRFSLNEMETLDEELDLPSVEDFDEGLVAATLYKGLADVVSGVRRRYDVVADSDIVLDVNTAANNLDISQDLKLASYSVTQNDRPDTPERFQSHQVLSSRSISTGQHYWEVETEETGDFRLGVAYADTDRIGIPSLFRCNDKSWSLRSSNSQYRIYYNNVTTLLPHKPTSQQLAAYLDFEAGKLSFYELSDPIRHLHTIKTTFNDVVHPGFLIYNNCWLRILH